MVEIGSKISHSNQIKLVPTDLQLADVLSKALALTASTYQELRKASEVSISKS